MSHWRDCDLSTYIRGGTRRKLNEEPNCKTHTPEQVLLMAVLARAIQDATGNQPNERREALKWLRADDTADWSLIWLLREIGWPACTRWRIWRFVNSGEQLDLGTLRMRARLRA